MWIERMKIWKKSKRNRLTCFDIYVVVFAFLSSTIKVGRWYKLNKMFAFGILFIWLLRLLWNEVFKNSLITFGWQLSAYFYQILNKCYCLIFLTDLFTWTSVSSDSQKYKVRRNLEVP